MKKLAIPGCIGVLALGWLCPFSVIADTASSGNALAQMDHQATIAMKKHQGYFSERCVQFDAGTRVDYRFQSPEPVNFNVHVHTDESTLYPVKLKARQQYEGVLDIDTAMEYCFMWTSTIDTETDWQLQFDYGYVKGALNAQ